MKTEQLKPVEVILRSGRRMRENNGAVHWAHIWICHNEPVLYDYYTLIKMFKKIAIM
jgi:hypothetical protein